MADDLRRVGEWANAWHMSLSVPKSLHLHLGRSAPVQLTLFDTPLQPVTLVKDLGVILSSDLKQHAQTASALQKARGAFAYIRRCFRRLTISNLLPAYKSLVRPLLEYGIQAWSPQAIGDCFKLKQFQRMVTRKVPELRHLPYDERLRQLKLFSLQRRRIRGDLISVFRIVKGYDRIPVDSLFDLRRNERTRGHALTLKKPVAQLGCRASSFAVRVVNDWNRLPDEVVAADSVKTFKKRLDASWSDLFPDVL